ncbi:MAG: TIGR02099 family protein [Rhodoferax sp.]|nr:TIGR02099 family protein [Rhodoferax sp.]
MIDLQATPSYPLKTVSVLARWGLGVMLAAWLAFFVIWGALHWIIVPRIGEFRPMLESRASALLGVTVRIKTISAYSSGMMPSFELTDVALFDAQGRAALQLPRVLASLSPRSIAHLGFEQLYIDQPDLAIRRDLKGKIWVAGLDFGKDNAPENGAADWFFSQAEFAIHNGRVHWTDELRNAPPLTLTQVGLVVRNRGRHHDLRLDATPPAAWGAPLSPMGKLMQPLLARHNGNWAQWQGQLYGQFSHVDLSELRRYGDLGVDLHQGNGAVTAWVDVNRGAVLGAVADVALAQVNVTLGSGLEALDLWSIRGRLGGKSLAKGFEFSTQGLAFDTRDGLHWPGGNVQMTYEGSDAAATARGSFEADKLDLGALAQIAHRLPLDAASRAALRAYAPKGLVDQVQATWQGLISAPTQYDVKGAVSNLELAAVADTPGLQGAQIEFNFNQLSGKARLQVRNGAVVLPGIFDDPLIPLTQLSADALWQIKGEHLAVQLPNLKFSNTDAQGEAQLKWETYGALKTANGPRFPGLLDLQGSLSRADGTRVHRYLPRVIDPSARDYVRDAIQAGTASGVKFKVKGDLAQMPFEDPRQGEFKISADVKNATFAFVPRSIQQPTELPWPSLVQLNGALVIDRLQLQVNGARARLGTPTGPQITKIEALIPQLNKTVVSVNAEAKGGLSDMLGVVNSSPLKLMIGQALAQSTANGTADLKLKLNLPIATIDESTVVGSVALNNNDLHIAPAAPKMTRARGVVNFTELGFSVSGAQARMLGGEMRLEGGSVPTIPGALPANGTASPSIVLRASGNVTAEGLRLAQELGFVARLAQRASGGAAYNAVLGFRRGEPELLITSNLQGLALGLPEPLNKRAEELLPFKLETALLREAPAPASAGATRLRDQLTLEIGRLAAVTYVRDISGPEPRVLRGSMGVGLTEQESAPLPQTGVVANLNLNGFDLDAWDGVLSQTAGTTLTDVAQAASLRPTAPGGGPASLGYLPTSLAIRAQALTLGGRTLHNVVIGGSREGLQWRANLEARELNGYLEYSQSTGATPGRVYARLARLTLAPGAANDVEALRSAQPTSVPALDIVVDDLELRGKRLGRVEIEAINRGAFSTASDPGTREWRLNKFNITNPEATFMASGNWARLATQAAKPGQTAAQPPLLRRTVMNFKLDIADSGGLLSRLGMEEVVRKGRGKMEGQVAWLGSPLTPDYPSMTGAFNVNIESGQFLKADPGIAKLLGVLSLQALPRRLTLDFRDVFSEGFAFDFLRGDVSIEQGIAKTNNLQMKGVNAAVLMEGSAHIAHETQDLRVVVVPELNAGTASLIASVVNPAVGLGSFLAQLFLRRPLMEAATQEFHIDGGWADPKVTKVQRTPPP